MINYWELLLEIDERGQGLTGWEVDFVEDLMRRGEDQYLTESQRDKIEQLHKERVL